MSNGYWLWPSHPALYIVSLFLINASRVLSIPNHSFPQPFFSARLVSIVLELLHGIKAINGITAFISVNTTPPLNFIPSTSLPIPPLTSFPSNHQANQTPLFLLSNMANLMSVKLDQSNYIVWKHHITSQNYLNCGRFVIKLWSLWSTLLSH